MKELTIRLASSASQAALLERYEPETDAFVPALVGGGFWRSLHRAHDLGFRGAGARVAIVDVGFDMEHPRLKGRDARLSGPNDASTNHGTCVTLLLSEAAPEAELGLYGVTLRDGSLGGVPAQIAEATDAGANVLNLSIQANRPLPASTISLEESAAKLIAAGSRGLYGDDDHTCDLCEAAGTARDTGTVVVAAAGNERDRISCPGRSPQVFAIGYIREERELVRGVGELWDTSNGALPVQPQSPHSDYRVFEASGVLTGTSFASPLYAGVVAIGFPVEHAPAYAKAARLTDFGSFMLAAHREDPGAPRASDWLRSAHAHFDEAFRALPHVHLRVEGLTFEEPSSCPWCPFYVTSLYVNWGLTMHHADRLDLAEHGFRVAIELDPLHPDAWANLGATRRDRGDIGEARRCYDRALELANNPVHRFARDELGD